MTDKEKAAWGYLTWVDKSPDVRPSAEGEEAFFAGAEWATPKWIKCSERLPKIFSPVICFGEPSRGGFAWSFCTYEGNHIWRFVLDGAENKSHISHWYPLPEAPKEEE